MPNHPAVRHFEERDIELAAEFLAARHRTGRERFPILPARFEDPAACAEVVRSTMSFADGFAAEADGRLAGFLFAIKQLPSPTSSSARFAPVRGSMMFAHGHAVAPRVAPFPVYNALFAHLAEHYLPDGVFEHLAHVPAGDPALDAVWNDLGFGRATAFAARNTAPLAVEAANIEVRLATPEDIEQVYRLVVAGNAYHAEAPMFVPYMDPYAERDVRDDLRKGLEDEAQAFFLGFADDEPAGLLRIEQAKGSPLFVPEDSCYIGDTAVLQSSRGNGIGTAVLQSALAWARERGHRRATLHYVVQNPLSTTFWRGHGFEPVMYHLRRRLDERIAWARPR